jgi:hypothetical protein
MKNNLNKTVIFSLFFSLLLFNSCKKETSDPVDIGMKYYPATTGHWIVYRVDSAVWNGFYYPDVTNPNFHKTYNYFIKEKNDSDYLDNQNRPTIIIGRSKKDSANTGWYQIGAWAANVTPSTVEKVEENIRFIKMIFPIAESRKWNGNAYNAMDEQFYKYRHCFAPYSVNDHVFDSTVTVIQRIDSLAFWSWYQFEVYAANIGMVYKRYRYIERDAVGQIKNGVDYSYYYESSDNH